MADDVDDIIEFELADVTDEESAWELFSFFVERGTEIADRRELKPPASIRVTDANGHCFFSASLGAAARHSEWTLPQMRPDFPWIAVLVDAGGIAVKVRLQVVGQKMN